MAQFKALNPTGTQNRTRPMNISFTEFTRRIDKRLTSDFVTSINQLGGRQLAAQLYTQSPAWADVEGHVAYAFNEIAIRYNLGSTEILHRAA
jgi:hypothetical protein